MPFDLTIRDLADILAVTLVVYTILTLIRGTRAVQLAIGLGILFVVYAVSRLLGLRTLNWLLSYVGLVIPIAFLILFQPELRRLLEQLGRGAPIVSGFGVPLGREEAIRLVSDIARAARVLSIRKIGALIVLERSTGLVDVVETGIKVDAQVSVQLLLTIFFPNTPLHDGAVIIRGNRVLAAACLLPLSENPTLSKTLGTRHRAAIGITEETDAVAVVVSEETGVISVARDGELSRGLSEEELKVYLLGLFGAAAAQPSWWPWRRVGTVGGRAERVVGAADRQK
ncbi:MAG: diadenylate cyclase CdaA [Armatimonadota bacterium]|nr:diadenylate cyclase CdaA [Armatimonadota bacterium]MDR7491920.1 diadenylate cyclase CdaA [Armatimonadota bacterium]MDR7526665.1 diadenylate cyclase CdaA [Armatimonadota bacterium]